MSYSYDVYIINAISHRGSAIRDIIPARVGWPSFSASMSETIGSSLLDQRDGFEVAFFSCTSSPVPQPAAASQARR